jgi:hypothetical protein
MEIQIILPLGEGKKNSEGARACASLPLKALLNAGGLPFTTINKVLIWT